jgi:hypothetical protein
MHIEALSEAREEIRGSSKRRRRGERLSHLRAALSQSFY